MLDARRRQESTEAAYVLLHPILASEVAALRLHIAALEEQARERDKRLHATFARDEAFCSLLCPITGALFVDPAVASDGHSYERHSIREWIDRGHMTSPMTGRKLVDMRLRRNHALRNAVEEWLQLVAGQGHAWAIESIAHRQQPQAATPSEDDDAHADAPPVLDPMARLPAALLATAGVALCCVVACGLVALSTFICKLSMRSTLCF